MTIFDFWFLERVADHGWPIAVKEFHRSMRHQAYFADGIVEEIKLENRLGLPEDSLRMAYLYGEGD